MDDTASPEITALSRLAIDSALNCKWSEAAELNRKILESEPQSTAALNRLAKALSEMGTYSEARKIYNQVLEIDSYNLIAAKNLKRIQPFKSDGVIPEGHDLQKLSAASFLQEPGVTKIVNLVKLAEPQRLSTLSTGMSVKIHPKNRSITVTDLNDNYLGVLPDDISHQLIRLTTGGNKYSGTVKAVKQNGLTILIRETFRSKKFRNQPSFLEESHIVSFPSDHISIPTDGLDDSPTAEGEEAEN